MGYPTDHFQRAQFRQKHAGSKMPITTSFSSMDSQGPTIHPTILSNHSSGDLDSGSVELDIDDGGLFENFANVGSVSGQTDMTQQHSGLYALSSFSPMHVDPIFQYDRQTEHDALSKSTTNFYSTIHAFPDPAANLSRALQMESDVDKNRERLDTPSRTNVGSRELSASIEFHEQFKYWEASPQLRSISTPGTRHSLDFITESSLQNSCGYSTARNMCLIIWKSLTLLLYMIQHMAIVALPPCRFTAKNMLNLIQIP